MGKIFQEPVIDSVRQVNTENTRSKKMYEIDTTYEYVQDHRVPVAKEAVYTVNDVQFRLSAENFKKTRISSQTWKILDYLLYNLSLNAGMSGAQIEECVTIKKSVNEWCDFFGIKYCKENINMLDKHLGNLLYPVISYYGMKKIRDKIGDIEYVTDKKGKQKQKEAMTKVMFHILTNKEISNGQLEVTFDKKFLIFLADNSFGMEYNKGTFVIDTNKNPHSYNFAYKFQIHENINKKHINRRYIAINKLIKCSPTFPTISDLPKVKLPDGSEKVRTDLFRDRIIKPFERDMNALLDYGILVHKDADYEKNKPECNGWYYMLDGKKFEGKVNIKNFYSLSIYFEISDGVGICGI